ncbi:MAG: hypothetical protein ACI9CD_000674 [Candidatus Deianiraeaceae bacterium]|jgi:hypothetical protein
MLEKNPFEIFSIPIQFSIDTAEVDRIFLELQKLHHPDSPCPNAQKSLDVTRSYSCINSEISRGEAILRIFNTPIDSINLPLGFIEKTFIMLEDGNVCEINNNISELKKSLHAQGNITVQNIGNFAQTFIMYKYLTTTLKRLHGTR